MPVYNAMPFLPIAIESVLAQTFSAFQLLIVDDGSTDDTRAYLDSLHDDRIRILKRRHEEQDAIRNVGFGLCNTEYIALMDGDDVIHPRRLEAQLEYLIQNPDVCMVGCQVEFLVEVPTGLIARVPTEHTEIVERLLVAKSGVCHPTLMMRSSIVRRIGGYHRAGPHADVDFCLRMCEAGQAANLAGVYYYYRLHQSSVSLSRMSEMRLEHAYALESAKCRRNESLEPSFESFQAKWAQRSIFRRLLEALKDWATWEYRLSIIDRAERRPVRGYFRLVTAAAAQPRWCIWHLKLLARNWTNRPYRSTVVTSLKPESRA